MAQTEIDASGGGSKCACGDGFEFACGDAGTRAASRRAIRRDGRFGIRRLCQQPAHGFITDDQFQILNNPDGDRGAEFGLGIRVRRVGVSGVSRKLFPSAAVRGLRCDLPRVRPERVAVPPADGLAACREYGACIFAGAARRSRDAYRPRHGWPPRCSRCIPSTPKPSTGSPRCQTSWSPLSR